MLVLLASLVPMAFAQDERPRFDSARAWFESARLDPWEFSGGLYYFRLRNQFPRWRTESEIAEIRRRVERAPEHPDRNLLQQIEAREQGLDFNIREAWFGPLGTSRVALQMADGFTTDYGIRPDGYWAMDGRWAGYFDMSGEPPPGRAYYEDDLNVRRNVGMLMGGGFLRNLTARGFVPTGFEKTSQTKWTAQFSDQTQKISVIGRWDQETGQGRCDEMRTLMPADASEGRYGSIVRLSGWRQREGISEPVASELSRLDRSGRVRMKTTLEDARPISRQRLDEVLERPRQRSVDPIRGRLNLQSIDDYRNIRRTAMPARVVGDDQLDPENVETDQMLSAESEPQSGISIRVAASISAIAALGIVLGIWLKLRGSSDVTNI
ncbi:MAG: hypothetical protein AAFQ71_13745 [Planctomycetota bacterium]